MRINQELKNNIIIDLNDNLNYKVICDKYKISKNSVYKIKKELEQEYEKESSIEEKESNIEEQEQESNKEDSIDNEIFDIEEFIIIGSSSTIGSSSITDILLFITFLNANKIDSEILLFINTFELNDSDNVKEKIKEYITYFLNVKNIINK